MYLKPPSRSSIRGNLKALAKQYKGKSLTKADPKEVRDARKKALEQLLNPKGV